MLKVLIADDEKNICLMIQKLIDWKSFGMEVIGLAHNGVDAIRMIEELHPDVVITDIRMPGLDGLELVQKVRDMGLDVHFIIISGYKYFEYAHMALKLGVEHYILKPIDKAELEETLGRIVTKHREKKVKDEETLELKEQAQESRRRVQKHLLTTIIERKEALADVELERINKEYQCDFSQGCFVATFSKLDCNEKDADFTALLQMLERIVERELSGTGWEYINTRTPSGVISIINYGVEKREDTGAAIEKSLQMMRRELDKFHGYHITIGVGKEKDSIGDISKSIGEASTAIKNRSKSGLDRVIYYDQLHYKYVSIEDMMDEKHYREVDNMIDALDYEALVSDTNKYENLITQTAFYAPVSVYDFLEIVNEKIVQVLKNNQTNSEIVGGFEADAKKIFDFYYDVDDMTYRYGECIKETFQKIIADKKNKSQLPVRQAKLYVMENYSRQVSLEDVADAIHLSPAYLSTIFKKEMGINFSDFLISCRIEAAKELLKTTDLPIADVASQVGYTDSRYFSKTFTKVVGLKPSTYRKLYL